MDDARPFAGIEVVEFGQFIAVPFCAQLLAEGGAHVVKVESVEGDPCGTSRRWRAARPALHAALTARSKKTTPPQTPWEAQPIRSRSPGAGGFKSQACRCARPLVLKWGFAADDDRARGKDHGHQPPLRRLSQRQRSWTHRFSEAGVPSGQTSCS